MAAGTGRRRDHGTGGGRKLGRIVAGALFGALLALFGPTLAFADLQLATVGCSDGSSFDVSVDTDTLNMLTNAVTNLNTENLGLSCSVAVLPPPPLPLGMIALAGSKTTKYATGGGMNDVGIHFAFSAHVDPDTNDVKGHANIQFADGTKVDGTVFCYNNFGTTRFAMVGIMVDSGGATSPLIFQTRDAGNPNSALPSTWRVDDYGTVGDCVTFQGDDDNTIVKGNVVVRP